MADNSVTLCGNATRDVELSFGNTGMAIAYHSDSPLTLASETRLANGSMAKLNSLTSKRSVALPRTLLSPLKKARECWFRGGFTTTRGKRTESVAQR